MAASADRRLVAGRYLLGASLGRGGMGRVWRADDVLLGRPVAVKEVELPGGPPGAERVALREARAAARLNHPGVVTLHDVVETDGRLFLVMELVEAPTLGERVAAGGPLAPPAAARVGLQLVDALEAAHWAGIVHHDVKPANVMVPAGGRVKLADFGIASLQEDTQRTLTGLAGGWPGVPDRTLEAAFGSLPYVAPEQASGRRVGPAADLWALGATLWFAVEGTPPFQRPGPAATLGAILHDPPGRPARAGPLGPVRDGQFQFVVGSVRCGVGTVGEGIGRRVPLGQFCLAAIRVENIGQEGRTFAAAHQYLFDDAGNRHDVDWAATAGHGGRLLSTHLNPGQRLAGTLVYDVPDGIRPARMELHDAPFSGGASVHLG